MGMMIRADEPYVFVPGAGKRRLRLTAREKEALKALCKGATNKEAAWLMGISPKTMEHHRRSLFLKARVDCCIRLLIWALKNNHVTLEWLLEDTDRQPVNNL